jgi:SprT protein
MNRKSESATIEDLMRRAMLLTGELIASASHHFGTKLAEPAIRFDLRGKSAGQVRIRDGRICTIRYNAHLLARHPKEFLAQTVPHESAHVVAFSLFGSRIAAHGPEWQGIMTLFGASPQRCHSYDVRGLQTRRLRRYAYRCNCRTHQLTSIRHNRIRSGQVYQCRQCGHPLKPVREASVDWDKL